MNLVHFPWAPPILPRVWIDITDRRAQIEPIVQALHDKLQYSQGHNNYVGKGSRFNPDALGLPGELVFGRATGREDRLRIDTGGPDGGWDFKDTDGFTVDVKTTAFNGCAHIAMIPGKRFVADTYALVVLDLGESVWRGAFVGWTTGDRMRTGVLQTFRSNVPDRRMLHERYLYPADTLRERV